MKSLLAIAALTVLSSVAMAKGSSHPATSSADSSIIDVEYAQRVLTFSAERNAITPDGILVVCQPQYEITRKNECQDEKTNNRWADIFALQIPGHVLVGYEIRFVGSGYRNVILYFRKK